VSADWRFEPAGLYDLPAICALLREAVEWMDGSGQSLWTMDEVAEDVVRPRLEAGQLRVVREAERVIASCRVQTSDPDFWPEVDAETSRFLHRLVVARDHAGQGLTRFMIDAAADEARAAGCSHLRLDTATDRTALRRLYESLGFVLVDERQCLRWFVARYELAL
jgi:GNAT superfamily N-acetyltransferase